MSPSAGSTRRRAPTLSRQLVVRTTVIVALVSIVTSLITLAAVRQVLVHQMDTQLRLVTVRQTRGGPGPGDPDRPPRGAAELGNPIGTVVVQRRTNHQVQARVVTEGALVAPSAPVISQLLALPTDGRIRTVSLDDLGSYRVMAVDRDDGQYVAAVPLSEVNAMVRTVVLIELAVLLVAIAAAVLAVQAVVRRSLRPLISLASTAHEVGRLELERGEVALPMRARESGAPAEVQQVSQAFNQMLDNVESALAVRQHSETKVRQFVADASHELRNPLASIRGYAELTRRGRAELPEQTQFAMQRIESESARMSTLVEDLLLLARLDAGPNVEPTTVDLVEVVLNAVSDARVAGPQHRWQVDLPEQSIEVLADRHRVVQVVVNLLANARQHTPPGTVVTAAVTRDRQGAWVRVTDNGPGIAADLLGQVFERFARADVARAHGAEPSTGLGLAIVQAVMTAHGGTATVESTPGHTEFGLWFPRPPDSQGPDSQGADSRGADSQGPDSQGADSRHPDS